MSSTNTSAVKKTYGNEKIVADGIADEVVQQAISDAALQVDIDGVPTKYYEYAQRLYACHLLTVGAQSASETGGGVIMEKVASLQRQYKSYAGTQNTYNDRWEEAYEKLLNSLGIDNENSGVLY